MQEPRTRSQPASPPRLEDELTFLTRQNVRRVDEALSRLGPYGEVRLIVVKGRLRFIQTMRSEEVNVAEGTGGAP